MIMSIELISILIILTFLVLLVSGLPLAWTMGATAVFWCLILFSPAVLVMLCSRIFRLSLNYVMVSVPLFIFMGTILQQSGVADDLFDAVHVWSGPFRGGLAIGTILACTLMAAMVGVVGAEIVTLGMIALPGMLKRNYDHRIALGSICAGGGMATLIPPSVVFIIYAMVAEASVSELFLGGVLPGLLLAVLFLAYIIIACWIKPEWAPAAPAEERNIPLTQKLAMLKGLIMPGLLGASVLGSIYTGVATPSEAAGIGCVGALLSAFINKRLNWKVVKIAVYETAKVTAMLAWLMFGAQCIIGIFSLAGGDDFVRSLVMKLPGGKWGVIISMQLIMIFLGMFLDWVGIVFLCMPLFVPIIEELGFSKVWFGVVFCMNMHISYLSPPFGPSIFYMKGVVGDKISVTRIYQANLPYLWLTLLALAITIAFPQLSLWLPSIMLQH